MAKRRSLTNFITGRPPAPLTLREQLEQTALDMKSIVEDRSPIFKLYEAAYHHGVLEQESLAVIRHGVAVAQKLDNLDKAARKIVVENPRAFKYDAVRYPYFLLRDVVARQKVKPKVLVPGENAALHSTLRPMLETLVGEYAKLRLTQEAVDAEATMLIAQVMAEGALNPVQRRVLSSEAQRMYDSAIAGSSSDLPSEEQVQDRRAWAEARAAAVEELTSRGVLEAPIS